MLNSVYTLVDSLFVSWGVGDNAMGGVSIVFPFVLIQAAIATALGGGAASIISRRIGKNEFAEASETALCARFVFYATAILTTIVGLIFIEPMLKAFGVTTELYQYAKEYYTIILLGNIFSTGFSAIIRAEGKMLFALLIWIIPITINIVLDAIFIFALGWGVKGSAVATVICQFTSFLMSIIFFTKFSSLKFKGSKLRAKTIADILSMGLPALVQSVVLSLSLLLINNVLKAGAGTLAINTFAYLNRIIIFATMPFIALTQAISPIIGYNYGAKNYDRVNKTFGFAIAVALAYSIFALIMLEAIPNYLLMAFTNNAEIIGLGQNAARILAISLPLTPLTMLVGAKYQAEGRKIKTLLISMLNFVFLLPCAILMSKYIGLNGTWWSYVLANALSTAAALLILLFGKKQKKALD
jgi:putative MATE family efflux protein